MPSSLEVMTSSLEGVILIDGQGQIIQLNIAAMLLFRCGPNDFSGNSLEQLVPGSLAVLEEYSHLVNSDTDTNTDTDPGKGSSNVIFNLPFNGRRSDGTIFPASISFCFFKAGDRRMAYVWVIEVARPGQSPF